MRILLSILASIFIRDIGLKSSIFAGSFCGLVITVIVASEHELDRVPSTFILFNNLCRTGIRSSLKVWWNSALNPSGPGLFLAGRLLITASISLGDIGLFRSLT